MKSLGLILFLLVGAFAQAEIVEFTIAPGTHDQAWNTKETAIRAKIGDIIRVINKDDINHALHTYGAPCPHPEYDNGDPIRPGESWDCPVTLPFDSDKEGPLRDHYQYQQAEVWIYTE